MVGINAGNTLNDFYPHELGPKGSAIRFEDVQSTRKKSKS